MPMHTGGVQWVSVNAGRGDWGLDSSCVMTEKLPAPGGAGRWRAAVPSHAACDLVDGVRCSEY